MVDIPITGRYGRSCVFERYPRAIGDMIMLMIRAPFSALGGALLATMTFLGLSKLVGAPLVVPPVVEGTVIEFTRQRPDTPVETKRNEKPKRKPPVLQPNVPGPRTDGSNDDFGVDEFVRPPIIPAGPERAKLTRGVDGD